MARFGFPFLAVFGLANAVMSADLATAQQSATAPGPSTTAFVNAAAAGNQFEIDSSKLALSRTKSERVRQFAQRMVDDHTQAGMKFKQAVREAKLASPPEKLDAKHQAILDRLEAEKEPNFDRVYRSAVQGARRDSRPVQSVCAHWRRWGHKAIRRRDPADAGSASRPRRQAAVSQA